MIIKDMMVKLQVVLILMVAISYILTFQAPAIFGEQIIFNSTENIPMFYDGKEWREVITHYNLAQHDNASMLIVK